MNMKKMLYVSLLLSIILMFYSLIYIFLWALDKNKTDRLNEKLKELSNITDIVFENYTLVNPPKDKNDIYYEYIDTNFLKVNFDEILKENNDTVGWILFDGTKINYPIVKYSDNNFYLDHSFDKSQNKVGWIFLDYRNNLDNLGNNTIIYGHGRKDYTMFGSLREVLKDDFINDKKNHIIKLSTISNYYIWQIFSVYEIQKETYYITTYFKSEDEYQKFLDTIKYRSKFNFNTSLNINDKVLTLSTCKDIYGNRIVVHAKLIKKGNIN